MVFPGVVPCVGFLVVSGFAVLTGLIGMDVIAIECLLFDVFVGLFDVLVGLVDMTLLRGFANPVPFLILVEAVIEGRRATFPGAVAWGGFVVGNGFVVLTGLVRTSVSTFSDRLIFARSLHVRPQ